MHTTALNVATMYLAHRSMPNVYAISGTTGRPAPKPAAPAAGATGAAAGTLEDLFQNMDYCSCQDCNSVFSPAAYLVELLEFLDLTGEPHDKQNPIDVLLGRRPDLQHIQLSCENTNVALPYVDLVNEVLEYYVVNGNLTGFTGHDMTSASKTADLLANPQYVQDAAYDETLGRGLSVVAAVRPCRSRRCDSCSPCSTPRCRTRCPWPATPPARAASGWG